MRVGEIAKKVRAKNAGPYWITVDVFCGDEQRYQKLNTALSKACLATLYGANPADVLYFQIPSLHVLKFSFPRPVVQGAIGDRDMHGAQWGVLLAEMTIQ